MAAREIHAFGKQSAERIGRVVHAHERTAENRGGKRRRRRPREFELPEDTGRYKVFQLIDDLDPGTPGWDYAKFKQIATPP